ncbi:PREDICTED: membrane-spanning 4-domains subfamily A member 8-like isoform X2 [Chinchilla lanigera]|uniref:membrane-spanning 4-domains subfamily A member 8-like isoform X2 n=1 Tax=Chinchilla lanigera TaxID=34839 RepID=UPI00038EF663|nr:PREDICTED: membrane-spanning 4-domains subfamily A member 8-like isoform X2 [Chinchilla lanigera]
MPRNRLWIKKELRVLGVIQVMNSMFINMLGVLWRFFFLSQLTVLSTIYIPLALLLGYPFWSPFWYLVSGVLAILAERRRTRFMMSYLIIMNSFSSCLAVLGLLLLSVELGAATFSFKAPIWQMRSAKMLSEYLFLFTALQLFVASVATRWAVQAKRSRFIQERSSRLYRTSR